MQVGTDSVRGQVQPTRPPPPSRSPRQTGQHPPLAWRKSSEQLVVLPALLLILKQHRHDPAHLGRGQPCLAARGTPDHIHQVLEGFIFAHPTRCTRPERVYDPFSL